MIEPLLIKHHIRLDDAAAAAPGHSLGVQDVVQVIKGPAVLAVIAVHAAMELQHIAAAGGLVEPVDVLGHHCPQLSLLLPLGQLIVGGIGLGVRCQKLGPIEPEKFFRVAFIEGMA